MSKLFVDKAISIHASAAKVWEILTNGAYNTQWATEFSNGGPEIQLESTWELGSPVLWKLEDGTVIVEGNVTALEQNRFIRFTVFDTSSERVKVTEADGITFNLSEAGGETTLHVLQGDFSAMTDGHIYKEASDKIWDKVLPKVKELAEALD